MDFCDRPRSSESASFLTSHTIFNCLSCKGWLRDLPRERQQCQPQSQVLSPFPPKRQELTASIREETEREPRTKVAAAHGNVTEKLKYLGGSLAKWFGALVLLSRGPRPPPCHQRYLFLVVLSTNPRSCFVNSQLVCLLPIGIFNYILHLFEIFVSFVSVAC